jgi:hypothetical protein
MAQSGNANAMVQQMATGHRMLLLGALRPAAAAPLES